MNKTTKAVLALADGTIFEGFGFGAIASSDNPAIGEVVFNTSMYGYQEICTDPSYAGQILTFTYPHIGNVGTNFIDEESGKFFASGIIIRNLPRVYSNFRAQESFPEYLSKHNKMGLYGIDTRKLVLHLRTHGSQMGAMAGGENISVDNLISHARKAGSMEGKNYVKAVSCESPYAWSDGAWGLEDDAYDSYSEARLSSRPHVVALDCGIKRNIMRLLTDVGFRVTVAPAYSSEAVLKNLRPDALFLSNGPGDPATLKEIVSTVESCVGKYPIFGICLGHQILGQVYGGKTYKLKFGHRGGNHPVKDLTTDKVEITVQNHGFTVDEKTLPKSVEVTHVNLNDGTVEGLMCKQDKVFSVQYHPEASPGPKDALYLFNRFRELVVG